MGGRGGVSVVPAAHIVTPLAVVMHVLAFRVVGLELRQSLTRVVRGWGWGSMPSSPVWVAIMVIVVGWAVIVALVLVSIKVQLDWRVGEGAIGVHRDRLLPLHP